MKFIIQHYNFGEKFIWSAYNEVDRLYLEATANRFITKDGQLNRKYIDIPEDKIYQIPEVFNSRRYLIQTIKKHYPKAKIFG